MKTAAVCHCLSVLVDEDLNGVQRAVFYRICRKNGVRGKLCELSCVVFRKIAFDLEVPGLVFRQCIHRVIDQRRFFRRLIDQRSELLIRCGSIHEKL